VGIVSKSGTLNVRGGVSADDARHRPVDGDRIGGDPIIGTTHIDALKLLNEDPETEAIIMIGEIGGSAGRGAAQYIRQT